MKGDQNMKFKPGDLIVRDDTRHPEGTLVVDRHDQDGNMRAYPSGGGLELTIPAGDVARFSVVTKDEATPIYRMARFSLEGLDDNEFEGWTADKRWNGWAMPCFEIQQATKLAGLLEDQLRYDPAKDAFIGSSGDEEAWPSHLINLPDGGQAKVYAVGAGSWMWDIVEEGGGVWA
jgi:hypothetical protein